MNVVKLDNWRRSQSAELGEWIVQNAADIDGTATVVRMKNGTKKTFFCDYYGRHPHEAAGVALRLANKLAGDADPTLS